MNVRDLREAIASMPDHLEIKMPVSLGEEFWYVEIERVEMGNDAGCCVILEPAQAI